MALAGGILHWRPGRVVACAGAPSDEVKRLEGTWLTTSATRDRKPLADMKGALVIIAAKEVTIQGKDGSKLTLPFKVGPTKKPSDFPLVGGDGWLKINGPFKGIYELSGDSLKLCIGSDDKRPTSSASRGRHSSCSSAKNDQSGPTPSADRYLAPLPC